MVNKINNLLHRHELRLSMRYKQEQRFTYLLTVKLTSEEELLIRITYPEIKLEKFTKEDEDLL